MLIIEGSDCLGKTTFANLLLKEATNRQEFPTYYSHMSRPNASFDFFKHYKDMMSTYAIQDRFHLGGIVWHDAIWQARLEIIEGWLRSIGSIIVVFYASDTKWYKSRLENDERGNMLPIEMMCKANDHYIELVKRSENIKPIIDFSFDLTKVIPEPRFLSLAPKFPDENDAIKILEHWFQRLRILEAL